MRTPLRAVGILVSVLALAGLAYINGWPRGTSVVLGKVTMQLGGHEVVVTDCLRTPAPATGAATPPAHQPGVVRWAPCRDADITIRGDRVEVNGRTYGPLAPNDAIRLDRGQVFIAGVPATERPAGR